MINLSTAHFKRGKRAIFGLKTGVMRVQYPAGEKGIEKDGFLFPVSHDVPRHLGRPYNRASRESCGSLCPLSCSVQLFLFGFGLLGFIS